MRPNDTHHAAPAGDTPVRHRTAAQHDTLMRVQANYWIHGMDFKTSMATGCDGRQGQAKRSRLKHNG